MKALTLKPGWARLIAEGDKTIETRTWRTDYRGPIAIHSAKPPGESSGGIVAIALLADCRPMVPEDSERACIDYCAGAYSWELEDVQPVVPPVAVRGRQGLWNLPAVLEQIVVLRLRWTSVRFWRGR